jgi:hypothetical protein
MYGVTQQQLAALGVTQLVAHRGVRYDGAIEGCPYEAGIGASAPELNSMSSFSLDMRTALEFAAPESDLADSQFISESVIISAVIPSSRIVCLPTTGLGSTAEMEVVVAGSAGQDMASISCSSWSDGIADRLRMPWRESDMCVAAPALSALADTPSRAETSVDDPGPELER